jgi:cytochrome c5
MTLPTFSFRTARLCTLALALLPGLATPPVFAATGFAAGEQVRLTRSETLLFKGANFLGAPKGQEFSVLQTDAAKGQVYVSFFKEDGTLIAVTLPADSVEVSPPNGWQDLLRGVEAFRDQRFDEARRLLARAAQDAEQKALAAAIAARINGAIVAAAQARAASGRAVFTTAAQALRDTAEQLVKLGHLCLALPLDEGADHLAAQVAGGAEGLPASKLDRDDVAKRVAISNRSAVRCRQAVALHRLVEASKIIDEGLRAEPNRPELKSYQTRIQKDLDEAAERFKAADSMRRFAKGEVHALTAIEHGLKACADFPQLLALKKEMSGAFEERTAPAVTPAFLAAAKVSTAATALEEGHKLYTTRCTECHDLELLDSRGMSGWQKAVAGMSRRAGLNDAQQTRILEYIAAAQNSVEALASK